MILASVRRHASEYNRPTRAIHAAGMPIARGDAWNIQRARAHDPVPIDTWAKQAARHESTEIDRALQHDTRKRAAPCE